MSAPAMEAPRCGRPKRQGGGECAHEAGWGTDHLGDGPCKLHGGTLANVRQDSRRRLMEAELRGQLAARGVTSVTDPAAEYARLAGEVIDFRDICREQLDKLNSWTVFNEGIGEQARALVTIYERAQDRSQKTLADMLKIGLTAEALGIAAARPSTQQADALKRVLDRVFADLWLTEEQKARIPQALTGALEAEGLI